MKKQNEQLDNDLKNCNNMDQILDVVQKHYDLSKPFGLTVKVLVVTGVKKILQMIKAEPRTIINK
jgi:hypothetical protein